MGFCKSNLLPWVASMSAALLMLATLSGAAGARPARLVPDQATTEQLKQIRSCQALDRLRG